MKLDASTPRKITRTLFVSQSAVSAALITTATVNAIAGAELSGRIAWAGIPSAVMLLSGAAGAYLWGLLMERVGRRKGLALGLAFGALGALLTGTAIWRGSFLQFLLGMGLFGVAQSAMQLGRFAAAEVHPAEKRGRAIATVVLGGTIGSIVGPLLVGPSGVWSAGAGLSELIGPYAAALILFSLTSLFVFIWLRPDPLEVARAMASAEPQPDPGGAERRPLGEILRHPGVLVAITAMAIGQAVMVMIMVITSLHMKALGHALSDISLVISAHTFGMFAFSVVSGRMADRLGRELVIISGAGILIVSALGAGLSGEVLPIAIALFLVGLGWNLCYVGGSALLTDQLKAAEQLRMQGLNDLFVALASASGSLGSGFVFAALGYQTMGVVGAVVALIPLSAAAWWRRQRSRLALAR